MHALNSHSVECVWIRVYTTMREGHDFGSMKHQNETVEDFSVGWWGVREEEAKKDHVV